MLTPEEINVYSILKAQCARICPPDQVTHRLKESILAVCNVIALVPHLADSGISAEECVVIMRSLINKGFVKEFENRDQTLSFVPMGYWEIRETSITYKSMI